MKILVRFLLLLVFILPNLSDGQSRKRKKNPTYQRVQDSLFHDFKWRNIGPSEGAEVLPPLVWLHNP